MKEKNKILIVDDTPNNIQLLAALLSEKGYIVTAATGGRQALLAIEKSLPDLILLDIMMPEMDGYETCRTLKSSEITKDIPVIFLSAKHESNDIALGFEVGAVDYVTKPFNESELLARVKTHTELKKSRETIAQISRERQELLRVLCHDLSNPIGFVVNAMEMTHDEPSFFEKVKDDIKSSMQNSLEVIELVRTMIALEENKLKLETSLVSLSEIIRNSLVMLTMRAEKKNIKITTDIPDGMHVRVERTTFINSVVNNILTNAIKFSEPGGLITVAAKDYGDKSELMIRDRGIGMPENVVNDLFDVSKNTSRTGTAGEIGTGYGMPLIKKFVNAYGGDLRVASWEKSAGANHGTEVLMVLNSK